VQLKIATTVDLMNALQHQLVFTGGATLCALAAAVHDLRERRIPNSITGPAFLAGLALHTAWFGWAGFAAALLAGSAAGIISLLFWIAGGMGAGDVKLMAAVGCLSGLSHLPLLLVSTSIAAAVLGVAVSIRYGKLSQTLANVGEVVGHHRRHGLRPHPELNVSAPGTLSLPFALPIAAGCMVALAALALEVR
jgi:prepilin peptidase CpaA